MDRRGFLGASAAAVLAGCLWPDRAVAPEPEARARPLAPLLGLNVHVFNPGAVAHLAALGIWHARVPAVLQRWESEAFYRAAMQDTSRRASEHGISLLWYLHNVPEGYSTPARLQDRPAWMRRMMEFAEWTAALSATEAVQLWNEHSHWVQMPFGAAQGIPFEERGRLYAEQLHLAHPRIKRENPAVLVVSGATADAPGDQGYAPFLRGMLESRPPVDAVAVHAYGLWSRARGIVRDALRQVDPLPLWVTEFGNDRVDRWDPAHHLATWQTWIEGNERERLAVRGYGYCLETDPRAPWHGLLEPNGSPRSAYTWLQGRVA